MTIGVLARMWSGNINLGDTDEHVDFGFFDLDKLPINLCEPSKKILRNYINASIYKEG